MPMNTNISTEGYEPIERTIPKAMPALSAPARSPFFISNFPIAPPNNSYVADNFANTNIPFHPIVPPQSLNMAGAGINATAGVTQAPQLAPPVPAPTIASPLVSVAAGYSFAYNEVRLPLSSNLTISSYKVYRNSANNSASAVVFQTNPHNIAGISTPVVVVDNVANSVTQFYWVSAVSTNGQESNLTPAQSGPVANNAIANANSQLASSFHGVPLSTTWLPTNDTTLSNDGIHTFIVVTSHSDQFGSGLVSYNSATIDPSVTGSYYIYGKDAQFAGGAITYHAVTVSGTPLFQVVAGDDRLLLGAIATAIGSSGTGGGSTGGTSVSTLGSGALGGRGVGVALAA